MVWDPPFLGALKFNVDREARRKPGPAGIGAVLHNGDGMVLVMFSKHVGRMESNEAEVLAILEALQMFVSASFQERFIAESNSLNAISWVSSRAKTPWRFHLYFNNIKYLSSLIRVSLQHVGRMGNRFADSLAKQGVVI